MEFDKPFEQLEAEIGDVSLDFDSTTMRRAGYRVVDWIVNRISGLRGSPLGQELSREETERLLREAMPQHGAPFEDVFDTYTRTIAPNAFGVDHPRFFAFIPSAPTFVGVLADALAAGTNVFAGTWLESSGPSQVELVVTDWFKQILGMPAGAGGLLVSGGSVANLTALTVARHIKLNDETDGALVYFSDQTHASVDRALRVLGLSDRHVRRVPTDREYRLDTAKLVAQLDRDRKLGLRPFGVIANAGTTNTGAVDPLDAVARIAREYSLWFHVDAAYGGFAALTDRGRKLLAGIEHADSVTLDPHKWLYCPFETGCVLLRSFRLMRETFRILPDYMRDVEREERQPNFCDYGVQLTRSFRALKVWMTMKTYGTQRLREIIDQCLDLTEYAARLFQRSTRLEIVTRPSLGIFTFRYVPEGLDQDRSGREMLLNRLNENLLGRITASRKLMLSSTKLGERFVLRLCVLSHRTRREDVREALRIIESLGREVEPGLA